MTIAIAPSLLRLRKEFDARYPSRDRRSDGLIADGAHATTSDHYPHDDPMDRDRTRWVCALDIDDDFGAYNVTGWSEANLLVARHELGLLPCIKYIVSGVPGSGQDLIYSSINGSAGWAWRTKNSSDHVDHHIHVSIHNTFAARNFAGPWFGPAAPVHPPIKRESEDNMEYWRSEDGKATWLVGAGHPIGIRTTADRKVYDDQRAAKGEPPLRTYVVPSYWLPQADDQ